MTTTLTPHPPDLAASENADLHGEIEALCQLVRLGQGRFTLALIDYDLPRTRDQIIAHIHEHFANLNVVEVELSPPPPDAPRTYNVLDQLERLVQAASPNTPPDVLLITGLETLFPNAISTDDPKMSDELRRALQPFNLGRNLLADQFRCPVLIFLPRPAMQIVLSSAPDIVSWKSGYFTFGSDLQKMAIELKSEADVKVGWLTRWRMRRRPDDELFSQVYRLQALIADADALPAEALTIARLHNRLGWTQVALGDGSKAQKSFAEVLRLARDVNDANLIKAAEAGLRKADTVKFRLIKSTRRTAVRQQSFHGAAALTKADGLFGRDTELQDLSLQVTGVGNRFATVWGETGCGKTSLVLAGVVPALEKRDYLSVIVREWDDPALAIHNAIESECHLSIPSSSQKDWLKNKLLAAAQKTGKTVVLVCDQFEQFFTRHPKRQERAPLLEEIGACLNDFRLPCKFIFILREDYLGRMVELEKHVGDALDKNRRFYLSLFDQGTALRVMRQLANKTGLNWPDVFLNEVIKDLTRDGQVRPIELQLTGAALVTLEIDDEQAYARAGRAEGLLTDYLQATLESISESKRETQDLKRILLGLIEEPHERLSLNAEEIAARSKVDINLVRNKLKKLIDVNLVHRHAAPEAEANDHGNGFLYDLMHDVLVDSVLRLTRTLQDEHRQARRILNRALEDVRVKPRLVISLREQRLLRNYLPTETIDKPKVKALLSRSLLFATANWITYTLLLVCLILIFVQGTFTHMTIEQDFNGRLVIRRGLPQLGFLPLIGNEILVDTGFIVKNLAPDKGSEVQGGYFWELDNRRGRGIDEKKFYESFDSLIDQGEFLRKIGHKNEALSKYLRALEKDKVSPVRYAAARALAAAIKADESLARPAFEPLLTILKADEDRFVRQEAAAGLAATIRADASLAKPAFELFLTIITADQEYFVREEVAMVLATTIKADASLAKPAFELLLTHFKTDKDNWVRGEAAMRLAAAITADASLARPAFELLLTSLKADRNGLVRREAATRLTAAIKANPSLALPALEPLVTGLKGDQEAFVRREAAMALAVAIQADASLARFAFKPLLTSLKVDQDDFVRQEAATGLTAAFKADASLARPGFDPLLTILTTDQFFLFRGEVAAGLAAAITADASLAGPAFESLFMLPRDNKDGFGRKAATVLAAAMTADATLARPALEPLLARLKDDKNPDVRREAATVLTAAITADATLAPPAFEPLLTCLKDDNDSDVRREAATALAAAITADASLVRPAFEPLLSAVREDKDSAVRRAVADALSSCIIIDAEVRDNASQFFADYDALIRKIAIDGFAIHLAALAKEESNNGRDPVQFLFEHLEGRQSLMTNGNAVTYAGYRLAVQGAMARWMASKTPEAVATRDRLTERLETIRDQDSRLYLRISAWDTLAAAANLRGRQGPGSSEDIEG